MLTFTKSFKKDFLIYTRNGGSSRVIAIYDKTTNELRIVKDGANFSDNTVATKFEEGYCPVCRDKYFKLETSGWDCGSNLCALGFINKEARLHTWMDTHNINDLKELIKDYYEHCGSEVIQKHATLIERALGEQKRMKELKEHWANNPYYGMTEEEEWLADTPGYDSRGKMIPGWNSNIGAEVDREFG